MVNVVPRRVPKSCLLQLSLVVYGTVLNGKASRTESWVIEIWGDNNRRGYVREILFWDVLRLGKGIGVGGSIRLLSNPRA